MTYLGKIWLPANYWLAIVLLIGLTACAGQVVQTDPTATPTEEEAVTDEAVEETTADEDGAEAEAEIETATTAVACNAVDIPRNPNIVPLSDADWAKGGPADAPVTLIEYGDFQ